MTEGAAADVVVVDDAVVVDEVVEDDVVTGPDPELIFTTESTLLSTVSSREFNADFM